VIDLLARLPKDRLGEGTLDFTHPGVPILGCSIVAPVVVRFRCRGKADNATAAAHGNPSRNPRRPFGDHPLGKYRVTLVRASVSELYSFGPWKFDVQPLNPDGSDECAARERAEAGDDGILIHGGTPGPAGSNSLRAAFGCLRIENDAAHFMAPLVQKALLAKELVAYTVVLI
jgi:hypothetical protein